MWTFYFIDVIENFGCLMVLTLAIASIVAFISGTVGASYNWDDRDVEKRVFKTSFTVLLIAALFLVFLPSKKTMYLMVGAYAVERVVETPEAKEFGDKLLKIVNNKLDELTKETK